MKNAVKALSAVLVIAALLALTAGVLGLLGKEKIFGVLCLTAAVIAMAGVINALMGDLTFSRIAGSQDAVRLIASGAFLAAAAAASAAIGLTAGVENVKKA